ncbi:amidohydrolase family protein [Thermomicrobiaceae bacterium CFH 74404]|uniref:Amidohydrolase family protein n=1 Tax=Thermalbibacter longus TaxID=2951981 RepID=A0AA41W9Q2_9BACT|nr:amidohydrolase family protein [Thermalbibacter longus]MCM8748429.1 amidohydrolase family protein [Thermalbibacter longus]
MALVLHGAVVWDGVHPEPRSGLVVVVERDRIVDVGPADRFSPRDHQVIDLSGAFLMPGLIDMHVHLVWSGGSDPANVVASEGEQLTVIRAVENARAELEAGITTVRDLGGNWDIPLSVARAIERGYVCGPRVVACGQTIIMTGGHDPFWGIASDGPQAVLHAVRRQISLGARVIKVAATGGVYGRPEGEEVGQSELTEEELAVAAREAHRFGLRVAAHAIGADGIGNAVRAGVDTIEHGIYLTEELVAEMAARGTALCPTLLVYRTIAENRSGTIPAYAVHKARQAAYAHRSSFRMALDVGIPIVAGTDAGSPDTPHPSLVAELELMCEYGMAPDQALASATRVAADVLGLGATLGTLEPGKRADLLVVDGNPLEELGQLRRVRCVLRSGALVSASS